jgi:hypothetical protein
MLEEKLIIAEIATQEIHHSNKKKEQEEAAIRRASIAKK